MRTRAPDRPTAGSWRRRAAVVLALALVAVAAPPSTAAGPGFERESPFPILRPSPMGGDKLAITSPSVVIVDGVYHMVYAGFGTKIQLYGATSHDGVHWTKRETPVLPHTPTPAWREGGVAEAEVVRGADGAFYLFFTALGPDESRSIGVARSTVGPFGPWQVKPTPLIQRSGTFPKALAPNVLVDPRGDGRTFLYYAVANQGEGIWSMRVATTQDPLWDPVTQRWARFTTVNGDRAIVRTPRGCCMGDPSVVHDDGVFHLFFTCLTNRTRLGLATAHLGTCEATSQTGMSFEADESPVVFWPRLAPAWDENVETPFVMKDDGRYVMWYVGYRGSVLNPASFYGASVGLATSARP